MPSIDVWGPPTWCLFHVLAENINEETYNVAFPQLFVFIKRICAFLPCPDCAKHATQLLNKLTPNDLSSKEKLKNTFYIFHNMVNKKKLKGLYNYANMEKYKFIPLPSAFNNFVNVFNTKGNMNLLTDAFHRKMILTEFKTWLLKNVGFFSKPK